MATAASAKAMRIRITRVVLLLRFYHYISG